MKLIHTCKKGEPSIQKHWTLIPPKTAELQTTLQALQGAVGGQLQEALSKAIGKPVARFTKEQLALIANTPELAQGISDLLSGAVPSEEIANKIKDIFDALDGTTINGKRRIGQGFVGGVFHNIVYVES